MFQVAKLRFTNQDQSQCMQLTVCNIRRKVLLKRVHNDKKNPYWVYIIYFTEFIYIVYVCDKICNIIHMRIFKHVTFDRHILRN
jgi:hypothetical protein